MCSTQHYHREVFLLHPPFHLWLSKKNKRVVVEPLNLSKTQKGYVPLVDRFKSFPKDSEKSPRNDQEFYFDNHANQTLEHADIGLLFPTPKWLRRRLLKQGLEGAYITTGNGLLLLANNKYLVSVEKA